MTPGCLHCRAGCALCLPWLAPSVAPILDSMNRARRLWLLGDVDGAKATAEGARTAFRDLDASTRSGLEDSLRRLAPRSGRAALHMGDLAFFRAERSGVLVLESNTVVS